LHQRSTGFELLTGIIQRGDATYPDDWNLAAQVGAEGTQNLGTFYHQGDTRESTGFTSVVVGIHPSAIQRGVGGDESV
jgi:hypothetical protein